MKIAIGCDEAAFEAKKRVIQYLKSLDIEVIDFGIKEEEVGMRLSYVPVAYETAKFVAEKNADWGILICGSGVGMSIVANKVPGIRAGLCQNTFCADSIRKHNNANILCMGARVNTPEEMIEFVKIFLNTEAEGGRHANRVAEIIEIDNNRKRF